MLQLALVRTLFLFFVLLARHDAFVANPVGPSTFR